jgi:hypothetical protein
MKREDFKQGERVGGGLWVGQRQHRRSGKACLLAKAK